MTIFGPAGAGLLTPLGTPGISAAGIARTATPRGVIITLFLLDMHM